MLSDESVKDISFLRFSKDTFDELYSISRSKEKNKNEKIKIKDRGYRGNLWNIISKLNYLQ